jgi:hypothetical protein
MYIKFCIFCVVFSRPVYKPVHMPVPIPIMILITLLMMMNHEIHLLCFDVILYQPIRT